MPCLLNLIVLAVSHNINQRSCRHVFFHSFVEGTFSKYLPVSVHVVIIYFQFEQRPEPIQPSYKLVQPTSYQDENYSSSVLDQNRSCRSQDRPTVPMVTQDDVVISRRKISTSLDAGVCCISLCALVL